MVVVRTGIPSDYIGETHRSNSVHLDESVNRTRRYEFLYKPEVSLYPRLPSLGLVNSMLDPMIVDERVSALKRKQSH